MICVECRGAGRKAIRTDGRSEARTLRCMRCRGVGRLPAVKCLPCGGVGYRVLPKGGAVTCGRCQGAGVL
jgi:DnaJ-class molecular chaperone